MCDGVGGLGSGRDRDRFAWRPPASIPLHWTAAVLPQSTQSAAVGMAPPQEGRGWDASGRAIGYCGGAATSALGCPRSRSRRARPMMEDEGAKPSHHWPLSPSARALAAMDPPSNPRGRTRGHAARPDDERLLPIPSNAAANVGGESAVGCCWPLALWALGLKADGKGCAAFWIVGGWHAPRRGMKPPCSPLAPRIHRKHHRHRQAAEARGRVLVAGRQAGPERRIIISSY